MTYVAPATYAALILAAIERGPGTRYQVARSLHPVGPVPSDIVRRVSRQLREFHNYGTIYIKAWVPLRGTLNRPGWDWQEVWAKQPTLFEIEDAVMPTDHPALAPSSTRGRKLEN